MQVEPIQISGIRITDVPGLDPVTVLLRDYGPGQGQIIIESYGDTWSQYWGGMGNHDIRSFITTSPMDYLTSKLGGFYPKEGEPSLLENILKAVLEALRDKPREEAPASLEPKLQESPSPGWELIKAERLRQVREEGFDADHDAHHFPSVIARAAECYRTCVESHAGVPPDWPWALQWWKPKDRQRNLVRAGALYLAAADLSDAQGHHVNAKGYRDGAVLCAHAINQLPTEGR